MNQLFCPECETRLKAAETLQMGQRIICLDCGAKLEVVSINPVEVDIANYRIPGQKPGEKTVEVDCPACDDFVRVSARARLGQHIYCPHCQAELEVVSVHPLELEEATMVNHKPNRRRQDADDDRRNNRRMPREQKPKKKGKPKRRPDEFDEF